MNYILQRIGFFAIIMVSFYITACDETTEIKPDKTGDTTLTQNYTIYYPMSQSDGWRPEHSGLFMYSFLGNNPAERIHSESIVHTSAVGQDGKIVMEFEYLPSKFWGRFADESFMEIPFPEASQYSEEWEYKYSIPPHIELSSDGNNAVFFTTLDLKDTQNPLEGEPKLIIFDFSIWEMSIYEIKPFVLKTFPQNNIDFVETYGETFLVNEDASKVWFVLKGMNYVDNNSTVVGYIVVKFENGKFISASDIQELPIELAGIDLKSGKIFAFLGDELRVLSANKSFVSTSLSKDNMSTSRQFCNEKSEIVIWTINGISLYNPVTEQEISEVISFDDIENDYPGFIKESANHKHLSISADGGLIAFALEKTKEPSSYDLFAIRRNGEGLVRIVPDTPIGIPVISNGFSQ